MTDAADAENSIDIWRGLKTEVVCTIKKHQRLLYLGERTSTNTTKKKDLKSGLVTRE